ncbi:MAG: LysM domain-containing protein [Patescibacteria group bacterium]
MNFAVLLCFVSVAPCFAKDYSVKEGDSVSVILQKYRLTEADLKTANPAKRDWPNLHNSEKLEIPYLSPVEVRAQDAEQIALQEDLAKALENIGNLTRERDSARGESASWQSKYEVAEPVARSAVAFRKDFWETAIVFSIILVAFVIYIFSLKGSLRIERKAKDRFRRESERQKGEILSQRRLNPDQPSKRVAQLK